MMKRALLISTVALLLTLPLTAWTANFGAMVYENGKDNNPIAVSGVKVEVLGGYGFRALFSTAITGSDGGCVLAKVPLGKEVLVRLTKAGYVTQYDIRSYSDAEQDVVLWTGAEADVNALYKNLGETFDTKKGHVYLEISSELGGEGISGVQLAVSSGKVFDFGNGEYLIANAEGTSLKVGIQKPGYAFDIESATIPLFPGGLTQYYIDVQSDGGGQVAAALTSDYISGIIKRLSDSKPISGVSIAFTNSSKKITYGRAVATKPDGTYISLDKFDVNKKVYVNPSVISATYPAVKKFKPTKKMVKIKSTGGNIADFTATPP